MLIHANGMLSNASFPCPSAPAHKPLIAAHSSLAASAPSAPTSAFAKAMTDRQDWTPAFAGVTGRGGTHTFVSPFRCVPKSDPCATPAIDQS